MATRVERTAADAYETDAYAWALQQAAHLRARRFGELDLPHLIEEVEDLAAARHRAVRSRMRTILRHILKLEFSPAAEPRPGWRETVRTQRADLQDDLTPTLRHRLEAELPELHAAARNLAAADLLDHGEPEAAATLPETCPHTLDQILDHDWLPPNRHGRAP
jgi:hypothetical protein